MKPGNEVKRIIEAGLLGVLLFVIVAAPCFQGCRTSGVARKESLKETKREVIVTCPFCGRKMKDAKRTKRRPVAFKIGNDLRSRPHSGLGSACVVFEVPVEGGITRLLALFLCEECDPVGPVRSARAVDIDIAYPFYPLFAHCGGSARTLELLRLSGIADIDELVWTGAFWRTKARRAPYNLYSSTSRIREAGASTYPFTGKNEAPFRFMSNGDVKDMQRTRERLLSEGGQVLVQGEATETGPVPVNAVTIPYVKECAIRWVYDPASARFLRFVAGVPDTDLNSGNQICADTIVVQYVSGALTGTGPTGLGKTPVVGSGRAQVLTCGLLIDANWEKPSRTEHMVFRDNQAKVIRFKPGLIWIELVPANRQAAFE